MFEDYMYVYHWAVWCVKKMFDRTEKNFFCFNRQFSILFSYCCCLLLCWLSFGWCCCWLLFLMIGCLCTLLARCCCCRRFLCCCRWRSQQQVLVMMVVFQHWFFLVFFSQQRFLVIGLHSFNSFSAVWKRRLVTDCEISVTLRSMDNNVSIVCNECVMNSDTQKTQ